MPITFARFYATPPVSAITPRPSRPTPSGRSRGPDRSDADMLALMKASDPVYISKPGTRLFLQQYRLSCCWA